MRITAHDRAYMRELRRRGYSLRRIAQTIGCAYSAVYYHTQGIPVPVHAGMNTDARTSRVMPKTVPEILAELQQEGTTVAGLARKYGLHRHTLWTAIWRYRRAHETWRQTLEQDNG